MPESTPAAAATPGLAITGEIGSGAIARVVVVEDPSNGSRYAGKILHDRHERDEGAHRRFQREAELASRLAHDNLVRVWGTRAIEGRTVMLMELVEGPNLADHLARSGVLSEPEILALMHGIASGLAFAHSAGVIHRDLKPANIMLAPRSGGHPVPKIADFGMARASSFASADKGALTVLGTPQYMAPECLEPLAVDPRTDLYALGCIVVEMATGAPPYGGATPLAVLDNHRNADIPELPAELSEDLRRLVTRLLAKAPGDRPQSASAVVDALDRMSQRALALVKGGAVMVAEARAESAVEGYCARCGEKVLRELAVCFACGLAQVIIERGSNSVFVTGPGRAPNKLDSGLRDRLVRWLRANAVVGLDATRLEGKIPRLPFTLLTGVSERSAETLLTSLSCLGIRAVTERGGRISHRGIMRKTGVLTSRTAMVTGAILGTPVMIHPALALVSLPLFAVTLPAIYGIMLAKSSQVWVTVLDAPPSTLPPRIGNRLLELHAIVVQIQERRHRDALRAVVHRVVALCRGIESSDPNRPAIEEEMEQAIGLAAQATLQMDRLDRYIADPNFDPSDAHSRRLMHLRDMWAARLLDLTAALDSLAARYAQAEARLRAETQEDINDLRAMVEALEEVQRQ